MVNSTVMAWAERIETAHPWPQVDGVGLCVWSGKYHLMLYLAGGISSTGDAPTY